MSARVPLAWLHLAESKALLFSALGGVAFTVIFSLVQIAFQDALYASVTLLYSHLNADIVLINPRYQCIVATEDFPVRRLYQSLAVDGVESVAPLYLGVAPWKNPITHNDRQIMVIGIEPDSRALDFSSLNENPDRIAEPGKVVFDEGSRKEFGPLPALLASHGMVTTELSHRQVEVDGLIRIGATFAVDGNVVTGDGNFFRLLPFRKPGVADLGLIRIRPGEDAAAVKSRLESVLPGDVTILLRQELLEREKSFFGSSLPVGLFFRTSVLVGLIVGAVIVYQILYSGVSEHLSDYATVKAIGYPDRYLYGVVLQEAIILSVLGFPPGVFLAWMIERIASAATLLPIHMTWMQAAVVYFLTASMCVVAGTLAVRKLQQADPVDIF